MCSCWYWIIIITNYYNFEKIYWIIFLPVVAGHYKRMSFRCTGNWTQLSPVWSRELQTFCSNLWPVNILCTIFICLLCVQQQELSVVTSLLNIKQHNARALLIHHRWKVDCIYDHLDRKGRDQMLREAGIILREDNNSRAAPSITATCIVCFDEFSLSDVSMECGHCFCNECEFLYLPC